MAGEITVCNCGHRFDDAVRAEPFLSDEELTALRGRSKPTD
jgi:hypothetical protein